MSSQLRFSQYLVVFAPRYAATLRWMTLISFTPIFLNGSKNALSHAEAFSSPAKSLGIAMTTVLRQRRGKKTNFLTNLLTYSSKAS